MRQSTNSVFERWEMSINYQFSTCILVTSGGVQVYPPLAAAGMVPVWLPAMAGQGSMSTLPRTRRQLETNNSDISVNNIQWKCLLGRLSCWPFINVKIEEPYRQEVGRCHPDPYIRTPPPVFAITISQRWRCWRLLGGGWTNTQDSTLVHSNKIKWHFTNVSHSSAVFWVWVRVCLSSRISKIITMHLTVCIRYMMRLVDSLFHYSLWTNSEMHSNDGWPIAELLIRWLLVKLVKL